jgi:excisionase family DNA binding protein
MNDFLTARDIAPRLKISVPYAYRLMQQSVIPTVRLGRVVRVHASTFERWLELEGINSLEGLRQRAPGAGRKAGGNAAH